MVAAGSGEILKIAALLYGRSGGDVISAKPTFDFLTSYARGLGCTVLDVALDADMRHDLDAMQKRITESTRLMYICNPNNPTGTLVDGSRLRDFIAQVSPQTPLLVDEAYHDFSQRSFVNHIEKHNNLVILRSLSKIGMAALRVGYAVADPVIIEQINKIRLPYNSNTVSQSFASQLLSNFSSVQKQIDSIIEERRRVSAS